MASFNSKGFFNFKSANRPINSGLCGIFLASICVWTVVYYLCNSVDTITAVL